MFDNQLTDRSMDQSVGWSIGQFVGWWVGKVSQLISWSGWSVRSVGQKGQSVRSVRSVGWTSRSVYRSFGQVGWLASDDSRSVSSVIQFINVRSLYYRLKRLNILILQSLSSDHTDSGIETTDHTGGMDV